MSHSGVPLFANQIQYTIWVLVADAARNLGSSGGELAEEASDDSEEPIFRERIQRHRHAKRQPKRVAKVHVDARAIEVTILLADAHNFMICQFNTVLSVVFGSYTSSQSRMCLELLATVNLSKLIQLLIWYSNQCLSVQVVLDCLLLYSLHSLHLPLLMLMPLSDCLA